MKKTIAGNLATGWIKILALAFMFADHAGKMLLPGVQEMRMLGRLAFPLYAWCLMVGANYTRSMPKYLLRILAVGLVSQPLYMIALNHTWNQPNVFLTLALGICGLWSLREKRWGSQVWGPAAVLLLAALLKVDYGWKGVLFIMLLYAVRDSRPAIAAMMIAFCLFWGTTSTAISSICGCSLNGVSSWPAIGAILPSFLRLQTFSLLALPLILLRIPREKDLRLPKWLGYAIYPAHLVVLYGLELLFK